MRQIERVADGKRRFFAASGAIVDVYLRDKRGHHDRALERGRDYEIEVNGVALRQVPPSGATVIILTGDREYTSTVVERQVIVREPAQIVERIVEAAREVSVDPPVLRRDRSNDPTDIRALQDMLTIAAWETCEAIPDRTEGWQDEFARLTAVMRAAQTIEGVYAAFDSIETFLRGGA